MPGELPILPEAVAVNPILESISNVVSALPAATFVGQPGSSLGGPGGFAATLAAARGISSASQTVAGDAGTETVVNGRVPASGNPLLKKLLSVPLNSGLNPTSFSMVTAEFMPALANEIPLGSAQRSVVETSVVQTSVVQTSLAQPMLSLALAAVPQGGTSEDVTGIVLSGVQTTATHDAAAQGTPIGSATGRSAGIFGSMASADGAGSILKVPPTPGVSLPDVRGQASQQETSMANSIQQTAVASATGWAASPNELASAEMAVWAGRAPTVAAATANGLPVSSTLSNGMRDGGGSTSVAGGAGSWSAAPTLQADQAVEPTRLVAALLANAETEAQPEAGVILAVADTQTSGLDPARVAVPDTEVQSDVSVQAGTENPISAVINVNSNGQISTFVSTNSAPTKLNSPATGLSGPRGLDAVAGASTRGAGQGAGARSSILSSLTECLSAGSDSGDGSPIGGQTPFSVFFPSPGSGGTGSGGTGPGMESAAATLPKMILPGTISALRDGHLGGANESSVTAGTNGLSSGNSSSGASQNFAPPNNKDSSTGTGSGSLPTGQASRRDTDLSAAASVQVAAAQSGAAPGTAPPASTGVTLSLGPVAAVADPLPKAGTLPAAAPTSPATMLPAETPAAAAPGPVQLAQMISRVEQSEMRIGMNTSAFGSVEVRAVVHASDVGLVIGSEKGDLRSVLANDMPAIANTLQQQSLRLNSVNFMQGFAFSNNASGGGDSQQHSFVPQRGFASSASEAAVEDSIEPLSAGEFGGGSGSLSILA